MSLNLQFFINLFFSFLDFTGFTLLSLSVYRIPVMLYWKRLLVIQTVFIATMLIHDYVLLNKDFYTLSIASVAILLSIILLKIPFLYSLLIWGTGYLLNIVMQGIVIFVITRLGIISTEQLVSNDFYRNLGMFSFFAINLLVVYFIEKKRLGFMFIMNRFRLQKRNIQAKDVFIATLFVCTISLGQLGLVSITSNSMNQYLLIVLLSMIVLSLIGLYITYRFNIKEIDERFSSLRGRNR